MVANSFTGLITTNEEWETIESKTVGVSGSTFTGFTSGKQYTFYAWDYAEIKIADAIFPVNKTAFYWKATDDVIYIKTNNFGCTLTILEGEE